MTTPREVIDHVPPVGKVYLPEGSYREMTEWVLPPEQLADYEARSPASWSTIRAGRGSRGSSAAASGGTSRCSIPKPTRCTAG